jgi:hypothetical protein
MTFHRPVGKKGDLAIQVSEENLREGKFQSQSSKFRFPMTFGVRCSTEKFYAKVVLYRPSKGCLSEQR